MVPFPIDKIVTLSNQTNDHSKYWHYNDVIMSVMASKITSVSIFCSTVGPGADLRKHQSAAPLAFVRGIHRWPVNSPHKKPVTRKFFTFDDVIMELCRYFATSRWPFYKHSVGTYAGTVMTTFRSCIHIIPSAEELRQVVVHYHRKFEYGFIFCHDTSTN